MAEDSKVEMSERVRRHVEDMTVLLMGNIMFQVQDMMASLGQAVVEKVVKQIEDAEVQDPRGGTRWVNASGARSRRQGGRLRR